MFSPRLSYFPRARIFSAKPFTNLVSFIHVYLHPKNQSLILIYSWDFGNQRVLNTDLPKAFLPITWETRFPRHAGYAE